MANFDDEFYFDFDEGDESSEPEEVTPREPGRRKKKPKFGGDDLPQQRSVDDIPDVSRQKLEKMFEKVSSYLSPEQRRYTKKIINGTGSVEPKAEMELIVRQLSLIFTAVSLKMFDQERVTRDFATFTDSYRQAVKDLNDMILAEKEEVEEERSIASLAMADRDREKDRLARLLEKYEPEVK